MKNGELERKKKERKRNLKKEWQQKINKERKNVEEK